ncbi:hypothetical protein C2S52_005542 [Perilla frutescens var. hirtella]|nr:hypothetical protein C2S51_010150 [Perilla frutescens var. frutescens]KAH6795065.1 hypothetical protein C2S52_005542 [Perilla frutescens var. hirtella]
MKNMIIRNLAAIFTKWLRYYFIFPKAVFFIWGLIGVHSWTEYAVVALLITHLADGILQLPKAVAVVNLLDGASALLIPIITYFSDTYLGPFLVVVCTTFAYISGLLLFYLGARSLKSIEKQLLYATVILVGLGRGGRDIQLKEFLADQCRTKNGLAEEEEQVESRRKIWWRSAYILGIVASVYLWKEASWMQRCKILTIAMGIAFAVFLVGFSFYERKKPAAKTTLNDMLRLLYAAVTKRHHTQGWLNRAVVEQSSSNPEEQVREGELCTVEQVEQLKSLLTMLPLWSTFLIYGLLLATGNTFFYEQTSYTANYLGHIPTFSDEESDYACNDLPQISNVVPDVIFVILRYFTSFTVSRLCDFLLSRYWGDKIPRRVMLVRIGMGLAVSPVCCVVAWKIEEYRVSRRLHHAICIRFPWLFPQFVLLGLVEGLVFSAMENIYSSVVPESLRKYGPPFTQFALNIGHFISLIFIVIFRDLFKNDLDLSRLGVYYRNLGCVCAVNFGIYCYVATYYAKQEPSDAEADVPELPLEQLLQGPPPESSGYEASEQQVG